MKLNRIGISLFLLGALTLISSAQGVKFKVLHNFGATGDGSVPYGPLIIDSKGKLVRHHL